MMSLTQQETEQDRIDRAVRENSRRISVRILWGVVAALLLFMVVGVFSNRESSLGAASAFSHALGQKHLYRRAIVNGTVAVNPMQSIYFRIDVPASVELARVSGDIMASGGLANDIEAGILDGVNLTNWINGHQARGLWFSGKITAAQLNNIAVAPGSTYYIAFNNRMSLFSAKNVNAQINLTYLAGSSFAPSDVEVENQ